MVVCKSDFVHFFEVQDGMRAEAIPVAPPEILGGREQTKGPERKAFVHKLLFGDAVEEVDAIWRAPWARTISPLIVGFGKQLMKEVQ